MRQTAVHMAALRDSSMTSSQTGVPVHDVIIHPLASQPTCERRMIRYDTIRYREFNMDCNVDGVVSLV